MVRRRSTRRAAPYPDWRPAYAKVHFALDETVIVENRDYHDVVAAASAAAAPPWGVGGDDGMLGCGDDGMLGYGCGGVYMAVTAPPEILLPETTEANDVDGGCRYGWDGPRRTLSTRSVDTQVASTDGSTLSSIATDQSETLTALTAGSRSQTPTEFVKSKNESLVCLGPRCNESFPSADDLDAHVKAVHTHTCNWVGCDHESFASHAGLVWHVKAEHLLVCPTPACPEAGFDNARALRSHLAVAHPELGNDGVREWRLTPTDENPSMPAKCVRKKAPERPPPREDPNMKEILLSKRKYQDRLRGVIDRRAKKAGIPRGADSPTDMVRSRASRLIDMASFPLVFEHAVLPFLIEFIPKWADVHHVISVTRGKSQQSRCICIMTRTRLSRARKLIIARHVGDLLPDKYRAVTSFAFPTGEIGRMTWARGLTRAQPDEICNARNPYHFRAPCMGDSIGILGKGSFADSTATLGPCLNIGRHNFWLANFHPFLEAYLGTDKVKVEHPSPEDRARCLLDAHDALSQETEFRIGDLQVTSGLSLKTTRISHDPYWEELEQEQPLLVTDWALITSDSSRPNMLRRFPSETQPLIKDPFVKGMASAVVPGAPVISSGRTSGYQHGQICEIPAYVSGDENGTQRATREWFIEEHFSSDDEEAWIRGGIGVEGDSGAAVVDADTGNLVGQLWGRNKYWGWGKRMTYFTPIADIMDDIQEKCGLPNRPQLPQHGDDADRYLVFPSCRQCYDLRTYQDSRRSSRMSLQSLYMGRGDGDQDLTSVEAVSELATPMNMPRSQEVAEIGASFNHIHSPIHIDRLFPGGGEAWNLYSSELVIDDHFDEQAVEIAGPSRKRAASTAGMTPMWESTPLLKKHRAGN